MGAALLIASAAVNIGGGLYAGAQEKKAARAQANSYDEQANAVLKQSDFEQAQTARSFDALVGQQKLSIAASGREFMGSPLEIIDQTLRDKETEISNIAYNASRNVAQLRSAAKQTKQAGRNAQTASIIGAFGSAASAAAKAKGASNGTNQKTLGAV